EGQPIDVAADDFEKAARLAVEHDMFGDAVADLRSPVAKAVCHLVDALIKLDRDVEAFFGEHALMLRDPYRQVEIGPPDRGEDQLVHLTCAANAASFSHQTKNEYPPCQYHIGLNGWRRLHPRQNNDDKSTGGLDGDRVSDLQADAESGRRHSCEIPRAAGRQ